MRLAIGTGATAGGDAADAVGIVISIPNAGVNLSQAAAHEILQGMRPSRAI